MDILNIMLAASAISFAVAYALTVRRIKKLTEAFATAILKQMQAEQLYEEHVKALSSKKDLDTHTENFIKFLSDSRDWAHSYIEDVQKGIKKFINDVEPDIKYYDEYGVVLEGMIAPHDRALKKISAGVKELKKLLPEETDDRR